MSDSIIVRVTLDAYDMASTGRQTQVYVQIPEVARVSWLLPSDMFHRLKDRAWPEVLDVTHDYVTYGGAASNSSATAAWKAVMEWLRDDANRDEVQAAFEEHEAQRHPVARKLLKENRRLRDRVAELETQCKALRAAHVKFPDSDHCQHDGERWPCPTVVVLGDEERPADEDPIRYALTEQAEAATFGHSFPVHTSWQLEVLDGGTVWVGTGLRAADLPGAEAMLAKAQDERPDVRFRLVRSTTTRAVEPGSETGGAE